VAPIAALQCLATTSYRQIVAVAVQPCLATLLAAITVVRIADSQIAVAQIAAAAIAANRDTPTAIAVAVLPWVAPPVLVQPATAALLPAAASVVLRLRKLAKLSDLALLHQLHLLKRHRQSLSKLQSLPNSAGNESRFLVTGEPKSPIS
jgi:hypothetical protein